MSTHKSRKTSDINAFSDRREKRNDKHDRRLGKIEPDLILNADGSTTPTDANRIQPYGCPADPTASRNFETSERQKNLVSIVILTYNQLSYTKRCVKSIRKHTPEPHEIIFIDNGSSDGTTKWLGQLLPENANYTLIRNNANLGFSKGCNQGIRASSGEYILLLNNDVIVTENWLSGMLECLDSAPDVGITGPMTNSVSGPSGPQQIRDETYRSIEYLDVYAQNFRETYRHRRIPIRRIVGFCMLFRWELVQKIGLIDESFGSGNFEDDDFCLRAMLEGCRNLIAADVFIHHFGSRSFIGNKIDYRSTLSGNRQIFNEKWRAVDTGSPLHQNLMILRAMETTDKLVQQDRLAQAIDIYLKAIGRFPDEKRIYHALAERLIEAKRFSDAFDTLNEMPSDERDAKRIELMGYCREGLEQCQEAEAFAESALALCPTSAKALNLKGLVAYKKGDTGAAQAFFNQAAAADPGYGEPYTNLGALKWEAGLTEEGLELLERGFILSPTVTDIFTLYHSAASARAAFKRAEKFFRDANALYPAHRRLMFLLIDLLIQQDKYDAAMPLIEEAMIAFGTDDGIVSASLEIRNRIGAKRIEKDSGAATLSLCMIVKNEEKHLVKCLNSVKPIVNEIIVVDTGSTDRTKDIARIFGAKVYDFEWTNNFSEARNFALSKAEGDWILILDADETISPADHPALLDLVKKRRHQKQAYCFTTRNYVYNEGIRGWHANEGTYAREEAGTGWHPSLKVRLFTNDGRIHFKGHVHELLEPSLKLLGIPVKVCGIPVHHYGQLDKEKNVSKGREYYLLGKEKLDENKADIQSLVELARQAAGLDKFDDAVSLWKEVTRIAPDHAEAYMNMAHCLLQLDRFEEALEASRKAKALSPGVKEAVLNHAACELAVGDVAIAVAELEGLLVHVPEYMPALGNLAAAYGVVKEKDKALACLDRIRKKGFDCPRNIRDHVRRFMAVGRIDYAMLLLELALEGNHVDQETLGLLDECQRIRLNSGQIRQR